MHNNYNNLLSSIIPNIDNRSNLIKLTPELDTCACNEFVTTVAKNKTIYVAAHDRKQQQRTYKLTVKIVDLMQKAEFFLTGYRLEILHLPVLKPEITNQISFIYRWVLLKVKTPFHID